MEEYNGILLIDKPAGFTSFDVVAKLRGISRTRKIGHAGTLDPMATGVLPLFFGRATKACDILPRQDKAYLAGFQLGLRTDTQDITGTVLARSSLRIPPDRVVAAARGMVGQSLQLPPMYSAVKVGGKKLYELARQGLEVERKARSITIHSLECRLLDEREQRYEMQVHCSKGAYIRTLAADLGEQLGCGGVLTSLRRTMAAGYLLEDCVALQDAEQAAAQGDFGRLLLPLETAFSTLPKAWLGDTQLRMFRNGVRLDPARVNRQDGQGPYAVYGQGIFWGTAEIQESEFRLVKLFTLEG